MAEVSVGCLAVGPLQANCYILGCPKTNHAVIIDPGGDPEEIEAYVSQEGLSPAYVINTHGHIDHIGANRAIKERYPAVKLCIHRDDAVMLRKPIKNLSIFQATYYKSPEADILLEDGSVIECGAIRLDVLHTPGHTPGGISLVLDSGGQTRIFSGDTLFAGGVGRTDVPGGDWDVLLQSIRTRLLQYPDETLVLPGHGPETTVGEERKFNPFLTG